MKKTARSLLLAASLSLSVILAGCGSGEEETPPAQEESVEGYTFGESDNAPASVRPYEPCANPSGEWSEEQVRTARLVRDVWAGQALPPRFLSAALLVSYDKTRIGEGEDPAIMGAPAASEQEAVQTFFDRSRGVPDGALISYVDLASQASAAAAPLVDPENKVLGLSTFLSNC